MSDESQRADVGSLELRHTGSSNHDARRRDNVPPSSRCTASRAASALPAHGPHASAPRAQANARTRENRQRDSAERAERGVAKRRREVDARALRRWRNRAPRAAQRGPEAAGDEPAHTTGSPCARSRRGRGRRERGRDAAAEEAGGDADGDAQRIDGHAMTERTTDRECAVAEPLPALGLRASMAASSFCHLPRAQVGPILAATAPRCARDCARRRHHARRAGRRGRTGTPQLSIARHQDRRAQSCGRLDRPRRARDRRSVGADARPACRRREQERRLRPDRRQVRAGIARRRVLPAGFVVVDQHDHAARAARRRHRRRARLRADRQHRLDHQGHRRQSVAAGRHVARVHPATRRRDRTC